MSICIRKEIKCLDAYMAFKNYKEWGQSPYTSPMECCLEKLGVYMMRNNTDYIYVTGQKGQEGQPP